MIATVGLIGEPVAHSLSPAMHNAAFAHHGLHENYVLWPTPVAELPQRIAHIRAAGIRGANITIPHKSAVLPLLDEVDALATAIGAVNTVVRGADGALRGTNTDAPGFVRALATAGFDPRGKTVLMLGAGGAARAVGYGLIAAGAAGLLVANRTLDRAEDVLADLLATTDADPRLLAVPWDDREIRAAIAEADLVVNATAVGLDGTSTPIDPDLLRPRVLVVDLIYHATPLLAAAARRNIPTQDGLEMLVQQGALAWEAWTGLAAPVAVMRTAAYQARKERL